MFSFCVLPNVFAINMQVGQKVQSMHPFNLSKGDLKGTRGKSNLISSNSYHYKFSADIVILFIWCQI